MAHAPDFIAVENGHGIDLHNRRERNRRIKTGALIALSIMAVAALIFGAQHWTYVATHEDTADAVVESDVYQVQSLLGGVISDVLVEPNQRVRKDQILARVDSREIDLREKQAETALQLARQQAEAARLAIAQIGAASSARSKQVKSQLASVKGAVANAKSELAKLKTAEKTTQQTLAKLKQRHEQSSAEYGKLITMIQQGIAPAALVVEADNQIDDIENHIRAAQGNLQSIKGRQAQLQQMIKQGSAATAKIPSASADAAAVTKQLQAARQQYAAAQTAVKQAQLAVDHARLAGNYLTISAPMDGVIAQAAIKQGQHVRPGQPLFAIVQPDKRWITANFDEKQMARLRTGQAVTIKLPSVPNKIIRGHISSIAPVAYAKPAAPLAAPPARAIQQQDKAMSHNKAATQAQTIAPNKVIAKAKNNAASVADREQTKLTPVSDVREKVGTSASAAPSPAPTSASASAAIKRTVPVRIELDAKSMREIEQSVLPGMSASVSVRVQK